MKQKPVARQENPTEKTTRRLPDLDLFLLAGIVVVITFIAFSPALKAAFINWDDNAYVFENPHLAKPIPQAAAYFFGPHYFVGNYIPMTMMTFVLEYHYAALKPGLYHTVNILFHLLNVLLVFRLIYLLSDKKPIVASIVAILFGIHPMHVESVAWVSELKDVQYTFFFLAGLIYYLKYNELINKNPNKQATLPVFKKLFSRPQVFSLILFLLAVLSKPAAVSFPLVLLLIDFYTRRKFDKWVWLEKVPYLLISLIFGVIAIQSQHADRLLHTEHPIYERVFFASHSLLDYLVKLFLPIHLSIFYPYPRLIDGHLPWMYYVAPAVVVLLFYGIYRTLKYSRLIVFGFLFFFSNIIFVLQLLSVGDAIMADRYTYVSYLGLFFILAMGFNQFYLGSVERFKIRRPLAVSLITGLLLGCTVLTYSRTKVWKSEGAIANDLLNKFPDDYLALNNKGFILFERQEYREAVDLFTKAIQLKPDYVRAYINLTDTYLALNEIDNAFRAINLSLDHVPLDHYLLKKKGNMLFAKGNFNEAAEFFSEAIRQKKNEMNGYMYLSETYYKMNDFAAGIKTLEEGLKYEPDNYILLNNKGYFLFLEHKYNEAIVYFKASLKIKPDYKTASINLSDCIKALDDSLNGKKMR